jgi:hypothetical protein
MTGGSCLLIEPLDAGILTIEQVANSQTKMREGEIKRLV